MTPAQLRAFTEIVRTGSVRGAADALGVTDAAVSGHVRALRDELGDRLYRPARDGLEFTAGGLRLAARAVEILGLQEATRREVHAAAGGLRVLRLATTTLFAEHAAPGLVELFTARAPDLVVEMTVDTSDRLEHLLRTRAVDAAIAPVDARVDGLDAVPFLRYEVLLVAAPALGSTDRRVHTRSAARLPWVLGPSAAEPAGATSRLLEALRVPGSNRRVYQNHAAAVDEARRGGGVAPALGWTVADDLREGRLVLLDGPGATLSSQWTALALPRPHRPRLASELLAFVTTPRALRAMIAGSGANIARFTPPIHVTIWR